jgi:two-component system, LuxR family, response regulator FixJ
MTRKGCYGAVQAKTVAPDQGGSRPIPVSCRRPGPVAALRLRRTMNMQSVQSPGHLSILVVDDDRAVRESLKFSLVIEGFAVRTYADAEQILAEPRLPKFDCLIVDQNMPGMNGLDLVSELRTRHGETPAILITSYPDQFLRDRAATAHIPIIEKPLMNSLLDHLQRIVSHAAIAPA